MPAVVTRGVPERYDLLELDPTGETYVVVKPATVAEQALRDELWARQTRTYNVDMPSAVEVKTDSTFAQRQALEVFLTLCECNLLFQETDSEGNSIGEPYTLIKSGKRENGMPFLNMSKEEFMLAWGKLEQGVADEIYGRILEKNPLWDMFRRSPRQGRSTEGP